MPYSMWGRPTATAPRQNSTRGFRKTPTLVRRHYKRRVMSRELGVPYISLYFVLRLQLWRLALANSEVSRYLFFWEHASIVCMSTSL